MIIIITHSHSHYCYIYSCSDSLITLSLYWFNCYSTGQRQVDNCKCNTKCIILIFVLTFSFYFLWVC